MPKAIGNLGILLHAHLPFVRHPEHEDFFEERWLFEAISETYIPLLDVFVRLVSEGVRFKITLSLSPTLLHMLADELLRERYLKYLENHIELAEKEVGRTYHMPDFHALALYYHGKYSRDLQTFRTRYECDLINAFRILAECNQHYEIITTAATHAFLPFINNERVLDVQIATGLDTCERFTGIRPRGIWLPECGYSEELGPILKQNGIDYFILESHGILYADPTPVFGTYAPVATPHGMAAFGRDADLSEQVWSMSHGYPGDPDYRDFYRDIGYDLDYDYIKNYTTPGGARTSTGIKYYRITGKTDDKRPYDIAKARAKAQEHAVDFISKAGMKADGFYAKTGKEAMMVCPFDAELFGHWWHEGPEWLYHVLRHTDRGGGIGCKSAVDGSNGHNLLRLTGLSDYIDSNPVMQVASPCASSWGCNGYNEVWLNKTNDWIYRRLHMAAERMVALAQDYPEASGILRRALNQAARELLLAQGSDWAFIMKTGAFEKYAQERTISHIGRFTRIYDDIKKDSIDPGWLGHIEAADNIFPDLDYLNFTKSDLKNLQISSSF